MTETPAVWHHRISFGRLTSSTPNMDEVPRTPSHTKSIKAGVMKTAWQEAFDEYAASLEPSPHAEDGSSLRKHSMGPDYPLAVVGFGDDTWAVQDLHSGLYATLYNDPKYVRVAAASMAITRIEGIREYGRSNWDWVQASR